MTLQDPVDLAAELIAITSVNPELDDSPGEADLADFVASRLMSLGAAVEEQHVIANRSNVIATWPGELPGTLVLEAHLDTVPMPREPMPSGISGGRLYGRGSCDTKASMAAMFTAIQQLVETREAHPTLIFAGAVDEEYVMKGARKLGERLSQADWVVIGEPTDLAPVRAHNGCVRFDIEVTGRTAHTSRATLGRNAIVDAARLITALQDDLGVLLEERSQDLTGAGLLTASVISGGIAPNVVPDRCVVRFDRRVVPGESIPTALAEVDEVVSRVSEALGITAMRTEPWLDLPPMELDAGHPLCRAAVQAGASETPAGGVPYCTDANILTGQFGIPSVVLGPGSIDQAHAPVEWVEVSQVRDAVGMYLSLIRTAGRSEALHAG
jgi:acetylornithine deacetylase